MADANVWLREIVKYLVAANTALPTIFSTVDTVVTIVKAVSGSGPSVKERAELIRQEVAGNAAYLAGDIARLEALIAARQAAEAGGNGTDD
jgi:hypothetical protein